MYMYITALNWCHACMSWEWNIEMLNEIACTWVRILASLGWIYDASLNTCTNLNTHVMYTLHWKWSLVVGLYVHINVKHLFCYFQNSILELQNRIWNKAYYLSLGMSKAYIYRPHITSIEIHTGMVHGQEAGETVECIPVNLPLRAVFLLSFGTVLLCSYREVSALSFSSPNLLTYFCTFFRAGI
jgi:hypothetical protein